MTPYIHSTFGVSTPKSKSQHGDLGFELHHLKGSHYWIDYYSHVPKGDTDCRAPAGRNQTKYWHDGFWVNAMHNPAKYGKQYGDEYLKHVPWQRAKDEKEYGTSKISFAA